MSDRTGNLRWRLREETATAHHALEHDLAWEERVAGLDSYRALLERFRGFHAMIEPEIGRALADDAFFAPRRRLALLDADLRHLGLSEAEIAALPRPEPMTLSGPAQALGALYVLEGSTLGGKVIGRRVAALHGFDSTAGCAYYGGHGDQAGALWRSFCARLDEAPEADAPAIVATADALFEGMRLWLCAPAGTAAAA